MCDPELVGTELLAKRSQEGSWHTLPEGLDSKCSSVEPHAMLSSEGILVMNSRQSGSFLKRSVENSHQ